MPMYNYECSAEPAHRYEQFESLSAHEVTKAAGFRCATCGAPAAQTPQVASSAFVTKGGNLYRFTGANGPVTRGNKKPVTVTRGKGLGGRRRNPIINREPKPLVKP
jgi:predicted nucleic acid-binding Zn ribbon protein